MLIRWLRDFAESKVGTDERIADVLGAVFVESRYAVELPDPQRRATRTPSRSTHADVGSLDRDDERATGRPPRGETASVVPRATRPQDRSTVAGVPTLDRNDERAAPRPVPCETPRQTGRE